MLYLAGACARQTARPHTALLELRPALHIFATQRNVALSALGSDSRTVFNLKSPFPLVLFGQGGITRFMRTLPNIQ